jgi:membrane-associated phospholipid phosphatase
MNFIQQLKRSAPVLVISILLAAVFYLYFDKTIASYFCKNNAKFALKLLSVPLEPVLLPFYLLVLLKVYEDSPKAIKTLIQIGFIVLINTAVISALKILFGRPRPELFFKSQTYGLHFFDVGHNFVSLPSGHAGSAGVISGCIYLLFDKAKKLLWLLPLFLAFTRVMICQHFVSDVILGFGVGFFLVLFIGLKQDSFLERTVNFLKGYVKIK